MELGGRLHSLENLGIGSAAAEVSRQRLLYLACLGARVSIEQGFDGHNLPGRTKAALEAIFLDESLLNGMEGPGLFQAFDGLDRFPLVLDSQGHAGIDCLSIDENGARPASSLVASFLRARESQIFANGIQEGSARLHEDPVFLPVDSQGYKGFPGSATKDLFF